MATCLKDLDHQLDKDQLQYIFDNATDWALINGLVFKASPEGGNQAVCAPFSLFPSVIPRCILQQAVDVIKDFNTLMYRVAQDHEFLEQALGSVIKQDHFVRKLWDLYTQARDEEAAQPISLDVFRNDFLIKHDGGSAMTSAGIPSTSSLQLKQVEINTISGSYSGYAGVTTRLHRYTLDLAGMKHTPREIPDNDPAMGIAEGIVKAWELYGNREAIVLIPFKNLDISVTDQRWIEFKIHQLNRNISVIRGTLTDVDCKGFLSEHKKLFFDKMEVAVVYMRTGFNEDCYPSDKEWSARLLMERSRAIKCPTLRSQLSGFKKVQQELAMEGAVERFIQDPAAVKRIRDTFVGLFSLDQTASGDTAVQRAIESPEKFVLKAQKEAGVGNVYGKDIRALLEKVGSSAQREAYILMEKICSFPEKNYLIKGGTLPELENTVMEIGLYSLHMGEGEKEIVNAYCGHMLRTKPEREDEGEIVGGDAVAVLDSPYLVDV